MHREGPAIHVECESLALDSITALSVPPAGHDAAARGVPVGRESSLASQEIRHRHDHTAASQRPAGQFACLLKQLLCAFDASLEAQSVSPQPFKPTVSSGRADSCEPARPN